MTVQEEIWPKKISVDKRIVEILSGSTYQNFPKALKEIITNSYDADASNVKVTIDLKNEIITVEDNGLGMSESDLDFYFRIAGKTREKEALTISGRRRIGKFGVGFMSVFPFCKYYNIESTKRGSEEIIFANIPCSQYFTVEQKLKDVNEIPIPGGRRTDSTVKNQQYTIVKLSGFTKITNAFFNQAYYVKGRRGTKLNYDASKLLSWEFSEDLPIEFKDKKLNEILGSDTSLPFNVIFNKEKLVRNVYATHILDTHEKEFQKIGKIKFKFFIATNYEPINPSDGRYLKIRNLNVGVGERETFDIGLDGRVYARLAHLTGEVNVFEGLNDLITVSRDNFNFSSEFEEFKEFFRSKLRHWANELDKLADFEKLGQDAGKENRVKSLSSLDKKNINERIKGFEQKGYKVNTVKRKQDKETSGGGKYQDSPTIKVDKTKREITVTESEDDFIKEIHIGKRRIKLNIDEWDFEKEDFSACKIKGNGIVINKNYPLFSDKKFVDVFIKMHCILLLKYDSGSMTKKSYFDLQKDILDTFSDYY